MAGFIVGIGITLVMVLFGVAIKYGKAAWLISGYNTASKKQKAKYDINKLCNAVGNLLFILGIISALATLAGAVFPAHINVIVILFSVVYVVAALAGIIILNTGYRVMKKPDDDKIK